MIGLIAVEAYIVLVAIVCTLSGRYAEAKRNA